MPQIETAMSAAFSKAGYAPPAPPAERLTALMREAIERGGGKSDASRDYFTAALHQADDRAELLWELFASVRASIIGRLFTETLIEMRAERAQMNAGKAGRSVSQGLDRHAEPAPKTDGGARCGEPQGQGNAALSSVPTAAAEAGMQVSKGHDPVAKAAAPPQRPSRAVLSASAEVARLSILRTFRKIGNRPLAEVTGLQAREWLKNHHRDGRFVSLVCYQVPDEKRIGDMIPEDEADRLYKLATDAGNA